MTNETLLEAQRLREDIIILKRGFNLILIPENTSFLDNSVIDSIRKLSDEDQLEIKNLITDKLEQTLFKKQKKFSSL